MCMAFLKGLKYTWAMYVLVSQEACLDQLKSQKWSHEGQQHLQAPHPSGFPHIIHFWHGRYTKRRLLTWAM